MNDKNVESTKWLKVIVHASPFFAPYLIPVLFYLFVDDASVKKISIQALLFQILMGVLIFISAIFSALLIGLPFLVVFVAMTVIVPIVGIVKAIQDDNWEYPIIKKFF
ncbi:membrane protein [Kurthia sp. 3B1D]|uniref:Membrane protein n=2 Tax=Kurthia TaxID=1649 RepID=A0A433RPI4_9BACL|nr:MULTISPECIES: DUF4870 domain-containing protein [unclassified Kurthia]RUS51908.1 membrane protein [Kurthia sp. 3B1D]HIX43107.1 DUF4870 domain-containing protein [Candidatus Kurthia intestinigallinarum]